MGFIIPTVHPIAKVVITLFNDQEGQPAHLVQIEGNIDPANAMRLAIIALLDRLFRRIQ